LCETTLKAPVFRGFLLTPKPVRRRGAQRFLFLVHQTLAKTARQIAGSLRDKSVCVARVRRGRSQVSQSPSDESNKKTATRAELLNAVYEACTGLSRAQARDIFEMTLDEISSALVRGETVKLRSFGLFSVRAKRERIGRNPRTGIEVPIKPRRVLTFRPSPVLVALINGESVETARELQD
jgi:integration host factor subunit alpha